MVNVHSPGNPQLFIHFRRPPNVFGFCFGTLPSYLSIIEAILFFYFEIVETLLSSRNMRKNGYFITTHKERKRVDGL